MNKFNVKRKADPTRKRKLQTKLRKKHTGKATQHQRQVQQQSGKRTGKAKRKVTKQGIKKRSINVQPDGDTEMKTAE